MDRGAWQSIVHGVTKGGHDWATKQQQQSWYWGEADDSEDASTWRGVLTRFEQNPACIGSGLWPASSETASRSPLCPHHWTSFQFLGADVGHLPVVFTRTVISASSFWVHVSSLSFSVVPGVISPVIPSVTPCLSLCICDDRFHAHEPHGGRHFSVLLTTMPSQFSTRHTFDAQWTFLEELNKHEPPSHHKLPSC